MFKFESLINRNPRWMCQSLLGRCHHSLTDLLNPTFIWQPKPSRILDPAQQIRATGVATPAVGANSSFFRIGDSFRQSQTLRGRGCHVYAGEMELPKLAFAKQLWEMSQRDAYCALYHPFVVAMAAGSLPMESFREYIAQDVFYLAAFAEAYGMAMNHTDDKQAKDVLRGLQHHVRDELDQVHLSAMQSFGFELPSRIKPNSATTAYTKFLLSVANGDLKSQWVPHMSDRSVDIELEETERKLSQGRKLAAFTVMALTPCMRLYAFLGQEIKRAFSSSGLKSNPYVKWVDTYASDDFEAASLDSEELLQKLALPFVPSGEQDEEENMKSLYRRAMELEVDFFDAQSFSSKSIVPLFKSSSAANTQFILVSDFDLTCTLDDSCSVLAELVMSVADRTTAPDLEGKWEALGNQYSLQYKELLDRLLPPTQPESEEYNPRGLRNVMKELSDFEREANARIVQSSFLAGLSKEAVKRAGSRVSFHAGCEHLLKRVSQLQQSFEFHILSVCWSRSLIQASFSSKALEFANIHSNELQFNNLHLSDGDIDRSIESAVDKEEVFEKILNEAEESSHPNQDSLSIYIGDSVTDLLCLLRADIGIVIGQSFSFERMAAAFGIRMLPLYTGLLQREQPPKHASAEINQRKRLWTKFDGVLYRVSSWNELNAFLMGS